MSKKAKTVMPYKSYNCITISQEEIETFTSTVTDNCTTNEYIETYSIKDAVFEFCKHVDIVGAYFDTFDELNDLLNKWPWKHRNIIYQNGSGGAIIGKMIDNSLPEHITLHSIYTFNHGEDKKDVDCVCLEFSFLNFENKTCGREQENTKQTMPGSKTQAADISTGSTKYINDDWHFYVFCAYHIPRVEDDLLTINDIYVGALKRSQWSCSNSSGSGSASIHVPIFEEQFFNVYHRNIEVSYSI